MKILVIGAEGQLGRDIVRVLSAYEVVQADLEGAPVTLDIRDASAVQTQIVHAIKPNLVVNLAAAHNVPQCEADPALAFQVNALGAGNLARACQNAGARLIHISTDYVFGKGFQNPIPEDALPRPLSAYGASKLAGEHLIAAWHDDYIIVRAAALYGAAPCRAKHGQNFVKLMLDLAESKGEVRVVTDEITTPTSTAALARQVLVLVERGATGLYHATCQGECSWHAFARAILDLSGSNAKLVEATSSDFPSGASRPAYSVLDNRRLREQGLDRMPHWRDALREFLTEIGRLAS